MDKEFHPTFYKWCKYLSMLGYFSKHKCSLCYFFCRWNCINFLVCIFKPSYQSLFLFARRFMKGPSSSFCWTFLASYYINQLLLTTSPSYFCWISSPVTRLLSIIFWDSFLWVRVSKDKINPQNVSLFLSFLTTQSCKCSPYRYILYIVAVRNCVAVNFQGAWMSNQRLCFIQDVITHHWPNINHHVAKPLLNLGHG